MPAFRCLLLSIALCLVSLSVFAIDSDADGIDDRQDNCIEIANSNQHDSNNDGFGNVCDADLDDSGFVNFADLSLFKSVFGTSDADADFDGSGFVNFADLATFKVLFGHPGRQWQQLVTDKSLAFSDSSNGWSNYTRYRPSGQHRQR